MPPEIWMLLGIGGVIALVLWRWMNSPLHHVTHLIRAAEEFREAGQFDTVCRLLQQASELLPRVNNAQARKLAQFGVEGDWGMALLESGKFDQAESRLSSASALASEILDADHPVAVGVMGRLALAQWEQGFAKDGNQTLRQIEQQWADPHHYDHVAGELLHLAGEFRRREFLQPALRLAQLAGKLVRPGADVEPAPSDGRLRVLAELAQADCLLPLGRLEDAEQALADAAPLFRESEAEGEESEGEGESGGGDRDEETRELKAPWLSARGLLLQLQSRFAESEEALREAAALQRQSRGADHPETCRSEGLRACTLLHWGDAPAARDILQELAENAAIEWLDGRADREWCDVMWAAALSAAGEPARADELLETSAERLEALARPRNFLLGLVRLLQARAALRRRRLDDAERLLAESLAWSDKTLGPESWVLRGDYWNAMGALRIAQERWDDAARSLDEARLALQAGSPLAAAQTRLRQAELRTRRGQPTEALAMLDEVESQCRDMLLEGHELWPDLWAERARAAWSAGAAEAAQSHWSRATSLRRKHQRLEHKGLEHKGLEHKDWRTQEIAALLERR